jgi:hypothetical protein
MAWINENTGKIYYAGSITINRNGVLFSGIPTEEQLTEWGFVEYVPPIQEQSTWEEQHKEEDMEE